MTATKADMISDFGHYRLPLTRARLLSWAQAMPANWFGRRGALALRKMVLSGGGPDVIDAEVAGLSLRLYTRDNVSERKFLFMPQFFDTQERVLLAEKLKTGGVFIDIGANAGIYALSAAKLVGDKGCVLAIEPNPKVMDRLRYNARINGFEMCMAFERSGVSDRDEVLKLSFDAGNLGGSSIAHERSQDGIDVRCRPLLDILRQYGITHVDAMKIDIEGAEDRALVPFFRDASPALYPRLLILENSEKDWTQNLTGVLAARGYMRLAVTRMNQIWELSA